MVLNGRCGYGRQGTQSLNIFNHLELGHALMLTRTSVYPTIKESTNLRLCKVIKFFARTTFHCNIRIAQATADRPQSSGGDGWWAPDLVRGCKRLEK
jgi:hypothetical protein